MRDLVKCTNSWIDKLSFIGIECGNVIEVKVNNRATNRWGLCKHRPTGHIIEISSKLINDSVSDKAFDNTLVHELLHTVKGTQGHKGLWKELAEKVNEFYGLNIKRTTSAEEKGFSTDKKDVEYRYKYIISCPKCKWEEGYIRYTKVVEYTSHYRCGKCKTTLIRIK